MSKDQPRLETMSRAAWRPTLRGSLLAISLSVPLAMMGCAAPTEDAEAASEAAFSGRSVTEGATLRVTATQLNLRSRASASSTIITVLKKDDLLTCVTTSGQDGWVHVSTEDGDTGWAAGNYLSEEGKGTATNDDTSARDGDTCAPERAQDVVGRFQKALHDTIAHAEGTRDSGKDGYNILFSNLTTPSCARHPNRCIKFGSTCTTAAGRYQFLVGTWNSISNAKGWATFEPENQERGAAYLISSVRKATVPQDRALTASEFTNVITKLSYEWASLPPGQYGQPKRSISELRSVYCKIAGC